ncbi:MAG: acyl carrier protein [Gammaproteobacteria bacterium]|nr:acyl carrier protein [Gammaproteobacteria bacterium]
MDESEIKTILRELVNGRLTAQGKATDILDDNVSLVDIGVIDSFGFLELVAELEEKTGVFPDFEDADPDQFTSINGLAQVILETMKQA